MARLRLLVVLVLGVLATAGTARAEPAKAAPLASAPVAFAAPEEEAPDSPRASMRAFLELAERGRFAEAAIYLDLPRGNEKRGAELAAKLYAVLSQKLLVIPEQLPLQPGTKGATEDLGKVADAKGHPVAIRLARREARSADDPARWVFSQYTVGHVDALYEMLGGRWIREHLPPALLAEGPLSLYYWQWVALPALLVVSLTMGRFLSLLSAWVARRVLAHRPWSGRLLERLKRPTTMGWGLATFAVLLSFLSLTLRAEDVVLRILRALAYLTFFWALFRSVRIAGDEVSQAEWARTRPSARSLASVGMSLGRFVVAALALIVALSELGYPVTSVIAGLGIGGVALALAAQKTVENLFGSISILADQPFRVGDTVRIDGIEGSVENIGLRSTRIRTSERTLVIFPNGKLADMRIESLGPRDRTRFATKLQLSRHATTAQLAMLVKELTARLEDNPSVRKDDISVRLTGIGEASFDVEVAAFVETVDATEFSKVRETLLVAIIDVVEHAGAHLAVPTREVITRTAAGGGQAA